MATLEHGSYVIVHPFADDEVFGTETLPDNLNEIFDALDDIDENWTDDRDRVLVLGDVSMPLRSRPQLRAFAYGMLLFWDVADTRLSEECTAQLSGMSSGQESGASEVLDNCQYTESESEEGRNGYHTENVYHEAIVLLGKYKDALEALEMMTEETADHLSRVKRDLVRASATS